MSDKLNSGIQIPTVFHIIIKDMEVSGAVLRLTSKQSYTFIYFPLSPFYRLKFSVTIFWLSM